MNIFLLFLSGFFLILKTIGQRNKEISSLEINNEGLRLGDVVKKMKDLSDRVTKFEAINVKAREPDDNKPFEQDQKVD